MKIAKVLVAAVLLSSSAYAETRLAMKESRKVEPSKQQRVEPKAPAKQIHRKKDRQLTPAEYQLEHPQLG